MHWFYRTYGACWQMGGSRWFLTCRGALWVHLPAFCHKKRDNKIDAHMSCFALCFQKRSVKLWYLVSLFFCLLSFFFFLCCGELISKLNDIILAETNGFENWIDRIDQLFCLQIQVDHGPWGVGMWVLEKL